MAIVTKYYTEEGLLSKSEVANAIMDTISATKLVSKMDVTVSDIAYLLKFVERINACDEYAKSFDGVRFEDMIAPAFLKDFFLPKKVSLGPDARFPDLLARPHADEEFEYDEREIRLISERIYHLFKKQASFIAISDARAEKYLFDIKFSLVIDGEVKTAYADNTFVIPYPVISNVYSLVGSNYLSEDANFIVGKYLNLLSFSSDKS